MNVRMADRVDRGLDPRDFGEASGNYRVEIGEGGRADIIWREELRFHHELADADAVKYGDRAGGQYKPWSHYTNGIWLTEDNEKKLVDELRRLTGLDDIETIEDGDADEDGYVAFTIGTTYSPEETVSAWIDRIGWPVVAELTNCTDPGTFNHPYLFSAMLYR